MITLSCPSCGAAVNFQSKSSVFAVCSFCKSTMVRHDQDLSLLGKMAELQDDLTPLQIGASGSYGGKTFEIIGRLQVSYELGFWNEWYVIFQDGREAWLAEAQGFYAICFPVDSQKTAIPSRAEISVGVEVQLKPHGYFVVDDIHDVVCKYSEGELPMSAAQGRTSKSVDLRGANEQMATIEYAQDGVRAFVGGYLDFDKFKFKNLKEQDGPLAPGKAVKPALSRKAKSFTCQSCGAAVTLRLPGVSLTVVCDSCHALIDARDENFALLQTYHEKIKEFEPRIDLGSRGELFGQNWELIGFLVRMDAGSGVCWEEYLLFNVKQGYRWLTHSDGHWNFVRSIKEMPEINKTVAVDYAIYKDKQYRLFNRGPAIVRFVLGEFYWRVAINSSVQMEYFVNPPFMLSVEKDGNELIWSIGEYVDQSVVKKAFKIKSKKLPWPRGIYANQPSGATETFRKMRVAWLIVVVILTCLQVWNLAKSQNKTVLAEQIIFTPNTKSSQSLTTKVFELKGAQANLEVQFKAPVDNSWFYISCELVNDDTGSTYAFDKSVEYYHGYESGESWTEGSTESGLLLTGIPGGKYYINYDYESGSFPYSSVSCMANMSIVRDVPVIYNYLWCLVFVSILPAIFWFASRSDEVARWSNSDYSPYPSSDD